MALTFIKLDTRAYLEDEALIRCSLAAQGLWIRMLCLMNQNGKRFGYIDYNDLPQLWQRIGCASPAECSELLSELASHSVFSQDHDGSIYSRRMVKWHSDWQAKQAQKEHKLSLHRERNRRWYYQTAKPRTRPKNSSDASEFGRTSDAPSDALRTQNRTQDKTPSSNQIEPSDAPSDGHIEYKKNIEYKKREHSDAVRTRARAPRFGDWHPAIQAFIEVTSRPPRAEHHERIKAALGETPDIPRLKTCYAEWTARGYNPTNLAWLEEWYPKGIPPSNVRQFSRPVAAKGVMTGAANPKPPTDSVTNAEMRRLADELERLTAKERERERAWKEMLGEPVTLPKNENTTVGQLRACIGAGAA